MFWGWLWGKRRGIKSSDRHLTNRGIYLYFKDSRIAESRKLRDVVERHSAALEFAKEMKESEDVQFQESFAKFIRTIDELLNSDSIENNSRRRMFMISRKSFWPSPIGFQAR